MEIMETETHQETILSYNEYYMYPNFDADLNDLRSTRIANGRTLVLIVAILTQVIVLAIIAMIMGIAVLTMCAVIGELVVITAVATALERQIVTFSDLATLLEVSGTVLITGITIVLAAVGGEGNMNGSTLSHTKFG